MEICFNGQFFPSLQPVITTANRSYKWGDGLFETMKMQRGQLLLAHLHFERLFQSLRVLQIKPSPLVTAASLLQNINALCERNKCTDRARIRLAVFRDDENKAVSTIEAIPLSTEPLSPLSLGIFNGARKSQDELANLKTANFLPYVMAARFAETHQLGDALVLNASGRICDSSKANVFLWKGNELHTPSAEEGCVLGVMRRALLQWLLTNGYAVQERGIDPEELSAADEIFLTNSIHDLRPVRFFGGKEYNCQKTDGLARQFLPTIYSNNC